MSGIEDKMNEFVPGIVDGQREFYHVAADGAVTRWWLVPGRHTSTIYGPADGHPLGSAHRPGWHDATGNPLPCDPREATE
ncbi:hypothetical protein FBT96_03840 [Rhodobacter capsulatus]|uniref:Uncharacterized protein n=1 Tax=Rhodobacter capsulatus TaxID=1061 RepID=A0A4U1JZX6_RHOCA|nr:hypothetical protein [Rhodobacter capsulatus]TKD25129.1 hypothetical protein FBT96_03840 [Rhodobacter capsulatus]